MQLIETLINGCLLGGLYGLIGLGLSINFGTMRVVHLAHDPLTRDRVREREVCRMEELPRQAGCGSAVGRGPTTATPWLFRSRSADRTIPATSTSSDEGSRGGVDDS